MTQNATMSDEQIRAWAQSIRNKVYAVCNEQDAVIYTNKAGLEAEVHWTSDITVEDSEVCGPTWYGTNGKVEVKIYMSDYEISDKEVAYIEHQIENYLNGGLCLS